MVPFGSKALFGMALATLLTAVFFGLDTNEPVATTILGLAAVGAFTLGLLVLLADPDRAPWFAPDAPIVPQAPAGPRTSLPSMWPLAAALALGLLVAGAASNAVVQGAAGVALLVVGIGWMFQHWSEHSTYTPHYALRIKDRFIAPLGLPVAIFALLAVIAGSLSRIFLALPEQGTRAVALAIAVVVLISAFAVAASERMARTAMLALCAFALACAVGAGAAGLAHGERTFEKPTKSIVHAPCPPGINPTVAATKCVGGSTTSSSTTSTSSP